MFNFPENPTVGDEFSDGEAIYVYTGNGVWDIKGSDQDLSNYVHKSGDVMSGVLKVVSTGTGGEIWLTPGNAAGAQVGMIEWYANASIGDRYSYLGWGSADHLDWKFENGCTGVRLSGGGIQMANDSSVTDKLDFSKGICLYGYAGTSQFGFTITGGTLNYIVQSAVNKHDFWCGTTNVLRLEAATTRISGKVKEIVITDGLNGYFIGDDYHGMCFNGSNALQFIEYHSIWQFVERRSGTTGGTIRYTIDAVGASGNNYFATAPEARVIARELNIESEDRGLDIVKTLGLALARIKKLEEEVASLRDRR